MTVLDNRLETAINTLKKSGVRITPQRHAVLEYLLTSRTHPTADEIYKSLENKFPNMSVATVYNNLRILRELGLVKELTYGDNSSRFDSNMMEHYHIICDECGKIVDFHYPSLDEIESLAEKVSGFEISYHRMELYGKCDACAKVKVQ
jgi:Fur family peroxide stress response transcriptional regulator